MFEAFSPAATYTVGLAVPLVLLSARFPAVEPLTVRSVATTVTVFTPLAGTPAWPVTCTESWALPARVAHGDGVQTPMGVDEVFSTRVEVWETFRVPG